MNAAVQLSLLEVERKPLSGIMAIAGRKPEFGDRDMIRLQHLKEQEQACELQHQQPEPVNLFPWIEQAQLHLFPAYLFTAPISTGPTWLQLRKVEHLHTFCCPLCGYYLQFTVKLIPPAGGDECGRCKNCFSAYVLDSERNAVYLDKQSYPKS